MTNELLLHLRKLIHKDSYYEFFKWAWPLVIADDYVDNWHIEMLCGELQEVGIRIVNREPKKHDLVINVSPGESKSTICTILFPVWLWTLDPSLRIISGSHTGSIAMKHAVSSKDCINHSKFKALYSNEVVIRKDIDAKGHYATTKGGERYVTSTGASVTGTHAHLLLADDLLNPEQATSKPELERASRWLTKTFSTRVVDKKVSPIVLIMQRLHEKDPTAVMLEQGNVRHICIPAEDSYPIHPPELKEFYQDGLMNPKRTDRKVLAQMKTRIGSEAYAGQFGQLPVEPGGGKIKRAWWQEVEGAFPEGLTWDMWIDGAYTNSSKNDPTGILVAAFDKERRRLYLKYAEAARMEMPELLKRVPEIARMQGFTSQSRVYIEPKASGKSLKQLLREKGEVTAIEITGPLINEGKEARIQVSAPRVEEGSVFFGPHPSLEIVIYENSEFPKAEHDEFVDLLGYACGRYFGKYQGKRRSATM